jgi:hypothetical protein
MKNQTTLPYTKLTTIVTNQGKPRPNPRWNHGKITQKYIYIY